MCDHPSMNADEIRRVYLDFMVERGHVVIPRAPLIPKDDPTTLFTGSGMQPLLPYLLGADHPAGKRLTDSQTCLRVQDIDEVGDNRHTTFFEMLGNWSLGDYFKREQLQQIWEFLTERVGLDPNRIYVTCFSGDEAGGIGKDTESAGIWTEIFEGVGISADQVDLGTEEHGAEVGSQGARIAFYGKKNWWCRGGKAENMPVGEPGGEQRHAEDRQHDHRERPQRAVAEPDAVDHLGEARDRDRERGGQPDDDREGPPPPSGRARRQQRGQHRQHARRESGARACEHGEAEEDEHRGKGYVGDGASGADCDAVAQAGWTSPASGDQGRRSRSPGSGRARGTFDISPKTKFAPRRFLR